MEEINLIKIQEELEEYDNSFVVGNLNFSSNIIAPMIIEISNLLEQLENIRTEINNAVETIRKKEKIDLLITEQNKPHSSEDNEQ